MSPALRRQYCTCPIYMHLKKGFFVFMQTLWLKMWRELGWISNSDDKIDVPLVKSSVWLPPTWFEVHKLLFDIRMLIFFSQCNKTLFLLEPYATGLSIKQICVLIKKKNSHCLRGLGKIRQMSPFNDGQQHPLLSNHQRIQTSHPFLTYTKNRKKNHYPVPAHTEYALRGGRGGQRLITPKSWD